VDCTSGVRCRFGGNAATLPGHTRMRLTRLHRHMSEDQAFGPMMDTQFSQVTFLALGVFFLIQVGIYVLCLIKLKEIQKQSLDSQLKLRLLDNEDNMFDAGLYVGLAGTVLSLVCLALGIIKPGLMAAYASTLFGIIFVSVLKILHVRPYRRQLILEEAAPPA